MTQVAERKNIHLSNFARFEKELVAHPQGNGQAAAPWLDELRQAGIRRFDLVGFPAKDDEFWRHSHAALAPLAEIPFELARPDNAAAARAVADHTFGNDAASELVFVNGHYVPQLSKLGKLAKGVTVTSLADALLPKEKNLLMKDRDGFFKDPARLGEYLGRYAEIERNPFVALNAGFLRDGAFLHFAPGTTVQTPIHLLFISVPGSEPAVSHPRVLVVAEEDAEATIVETYAGAGEANAGIYFTNAVTEIVAGPSCRLDHCKLQQEGARAYHVSTLQVELAAAAKFVSHSASIGSKTTRNDLNVVLNGEYADATLNGLVLLKGDQHVDNHTLLHHEKPNCPSHELYKHVLDGKSVGVFKGQIYVQKDAQKTDSKQTSKSLLLSNDAYMNSQPALEIYADDVKCTHGSTTGPVDEDQVFYLRTRGIPTDAARHLLTYAFAADVTRRIKVEPVRRRLEDFMAAQHGLPQDLRITNLGAHDERAM